MPNSVQAERLQLVRQATHWAMAAARLDDLEHLAAPGAWASLDASLRRTVQDALKRSAEQLQLQAQRVLVQAGAATTAPELARIRAEVLRLRRSYLRTEMTISLYASAINTRTNVERATLLNAFEALAARSMREALEPLGKPTPPVLAYLDGGLGASILKAGLRLWDGVTDNPAAMIKAARHNSYRPTALIHEAGHQVAHLVGWNQEAAILLADKLAQESSREVAETWAGWASEIVADAFAFVHTGYASVAALHDLLDDEDALVFRLDLMDPHPLGYLRVLLGTEMCRQAFGQGGPWDDLAEVWKRTHALARAPGPSRDLCERSLPLLPRVALIMLETPLKAFEGRSLAALVPPERVHPTKALVDLEQQAGGTLFTSSYWLKTECLRLLALSGYRAATEPERAEQIFAEQEQWLGRLGTAGLLV